MGARAGGGVGVGASAGACVSAGIPVLLTLWAA